MKGRLLMTPDGHIWLKFAFEVFYKTLADDCYKRGFAEGHKGDGPWYAELYDSAASMMAQALFSDRLKAFYGTDDDFVQVSRGRWRNEQSLALIKSGLLPHASSPHGDEHIFLTKLEFDAFMEKFAQERAFITLNTKIKRAKTGPDPIVLERVKAEMKCHPRVELEGMKQEAMAALFGASRPTCQKALREVLSELDAD